jgi:hypothetical protein
MNLQKQNKFSELESKHFKKYLFTAVEVSNKNSKLSKKTEKILFIFHEFYWEMIDSSVSTSKSAYFDYDEYKNDLKISLISLS